MRSSYSCVIRIPIRASELNLITTERLRSRPLQVQICWCKPHQPLVFPHTIKQQASLIGHPAHSEIKTFIYMSLSNLFLENIILANKKLTRSRKHVISH